MPAGILSESKVKFDITRRASAVFKLYFSDGNSALSPFAPYPDEADSANDDNDNSDENGPFGGLFFVFDAPGRNGFPEADSPVQQRADTGNFEEFVRVRVDGITPAGKGNVGSRASHKFPWFSHLKIKRVNAGWSRTDEHNSMGIGNDFSNPG